MVDLKAWRARVDKASRDARHAMHSLRWVSRGLERDAEKVWRSLQWGGPFGDEPPRGLVLIEQETVEATTLGDYFTKAAGRLSAHVAAHRLARKALQNTFDGERETLLETLRAVDFDALLQDMEAEASQLALSPDLAELAGELAREPEAKPPKQAKPRAARLNKIDKELLILLFQDFHGEWKDNTLHLQDKQLLAMLGRTGSGEMRPDRRPYFDKLREFWRRNPRGFPWEIVRAIPDDDVRRLVESYAPEAATE